VLPFTNVFAIGEVIEICGAMVSKTGEGGGGAGALPTGGLNANPKALAAFTRP